MAGVNYNAERLGTYPIDYILDLVSDRSARGAVYRKIDGYDTRVNTLKLVCFKLHGTTCSKCGLQASFFALERTEDSSRPSLQLYGFKNARGILFNMDHVLPKAHGGTDVVQNLQTMCSLCNTAKGKRFDIPTIFKRCVTCSKYKQCYKATNDFKTCEEWDLHAGFMDGVNPKEKFK